MFAVLALIFLPSISPDNNGDEIAYDQFLSQVQDGTIAEAEINNLNGEIDGFYRSTARALSNSAKQTEPCSTACQTLS